MGKRALLLPELEHGPGKNVHRFCDNDMHPEDPSPHALDQSQ